MASTYTYTNTFSIAGVGTNGAVVDAYKASRFSSPPALNSLPPAGSPDAATTTATAAGSAGAFAIALPTSEDYYISVTFAGETNWVGPVSQVYADGTVGGGAALNATIGPVGQVVDTLSVTGSQVVDWAAGNVFDLTMTANTTFTFSNLSLGRYITITLRGPWVPTWPTVAWQPGAPTYVDNGSGMSFEFWVTLAGEVRGAAIVGFPTITIPTLTSAGEVLISSGAGTLEALTPPSEIGQSPIMEGSDPSTVQWGYTRSLRDRYLAPSGVLAETISQLQIGGAIVMGGTGLVSFYALALPAGLTMGHINFRAGGTAANGPQHWWYVLADSSLHMLAVTADQATAAFGGSADHTLAIATIASGASATFKTTYEGLYYVGIMMAVSTTMPSLVGAGLSSSGLANIATPRLMGVSSDAVATTPPTFAHTFGAIGTTLVGQGYASVS